MSSAQRQPQRPPGDAEASSSYGEPVRALDIRDALVIKEGELFLLTDSQGNIPANNPNGFGLYFRDMRYLSRYEFGLQEAVPVLLLGTAELGYASELELTNLEMPSFDGHLLAKETLFIRRHRVVTLDQVLHEGIQITNYSRSKIAIQLFLRFDADFADIFEVRGEKRRRRGKVSLQETAGSIAFHYQGLDGTLLTCSIRFTPQPTSLSQGEARFVFTLKHRESRSINLLISPHQNRKSPLSMESFEAVRQSHNAWRQEQTQVYTNNEFFNAMWNRSVADLRLLTQNTSGDTYIAAGVPWYNALFGRDSSITALQMLPFAPKIARDTLITLSKWQGKQRDPWRDEESGKIPHELRVGEMARLNEIPMTPYYGSVDATPLFLMLAAEYYAWTADLGLIRSLEPNLRAALEWTEQYGDIDGDGYIEYERRSAKGLINQGWKDSYDGIVNGNGTLVKPPVALVEVQGYVYAAKIGVARLLAALGDGATAARLSKEVWRLRRQFNRDFWLPEIQYYALALDGDNRPSDAAASNPGHSLWTGIIPLRRARLVAERLLANDLFSGWGIRTLSNSSPRYNPLGYHLGTVWPHDNAIIAAGFKRYGLEEELNEVATALYDCCRAFPYYRLPELFSGEPRSPYGPPVRYPVACSPQAWAAGSIPMISAAILGLAPDAPAKRLFLVRPRLPYWLEEVVVRNLRVGTAKVDLLYQRRGRRTRARATRVVGDLKVVQTSRWPWPQLPS